MDLNNLTPAELASLKQQLAATDSSGRSPFKPRQLHDLRLLPTKDDPRPTFFWSAESPRDGINLTATTEFPKLMWHGTTFEEITVMDKPDQVRHEAQGYVLTAPAAKPVDPLASLRLHLEDLSEEDRVLVLEAQRQQRLAALQAKLAALPPQELEALLASSAALASAELAEPDDPDAEGAEPKHRGRPRKHA